MRDDNYPCDPKLVIYWIKGIVHHLKLFKRWYDKSDKETPEAKSQDAQEKIKYYFSHVINDVSKITCKL